MAVTQERLSAIVAAGLSSLDAYVKLKSVIIAEHSAWITSMGPEGDPAQPYTAEQALHNITMALTTIIPDIPGMVLLGAEQRHIRNTSHKNAKARERMRAYRERRGEPTPPPNMALIPRNRSTGPNTGPKGPGSRPQGPFPKNHEGASIATVGLTSNLDIDFAAMAGAPPEDFSGASLFDTGQQSSVELTATFSPEEQAIWDNTKLTDAEKFSALEALYATQAETTKENP